MLVNPRATPGACRTAILSPLTNVPFLTTSRVSRPSKLISLFRLLTGSRIFPPPLPQEAAPPPGDKIFFLHSCPIPPVILSGFSYLYPPPEFLNASVNFWSEIGVYYSREAKFFFRRAISLTRSSDFPKTFTLELFSAPPFLASLFSPFRPSSPSIFELGQRSSMRGPSFFLTPLNPSSELG